MHQESKEEVWRDIPKYEGRMQVSTFGRVRSVSRMVRNGGNGRYLTGRIRAISTMKTGYKVISLTNGDHLSLVHRLVAITFIPNPDNKEFVNHKDGVKYNNHIDNLEWVTRQENEDHAFATGLKNVTGSNSPWAKFTESDIPIIRDLTKTKSYSEVGKIYNVHPYTIRRICKRETWGHVI